MVKHVFYTMTSRAHVDRSVTIAVGMLLPFIYLHVTLMEISLQNRFYLHFSVVCRWSFIRMFPFDNSGASARKLRISTNKKS